MEQDDSRDFSDALHMSHGMNTQHTKLYSPASKSQTKEMILESLLSW